MNNRPHQGLIALMTGLYLVLQTMLILQQASALAPYAERVQLLIIFMTADLLFLSLAYLWNKKNQSFLMTYISAVCIIVGIGASYQFLFSSFSKYVLTAALGLAVGLAAFFWWRRIHTLSDRQFHFLAILAAGLLAANLAFGQTKYGARLWLVIFGVSIQPSEILKVLLLLLGANSYRSFRRSAIYGLLCTASCAAMVLLHDLGSAVVIFAMFLMTFTCLLDNWKFTLAVILAAAAAFILSIAINPHAAARLESWGKAMSTSTGAGWQQSRYIKACLYGGFWGLGLENAELMTKVIFSSTDASMAGCLAVYGVPTLVSALGSYFILITQPLYNRSIFPSCFLILSQLSVCLALQVLLNLAGALDVLPFTGVVCPFVSSGGTSAISFGAMLGLGAAALSPSLSQKGDPYASL